MKKNLLVFAFTLLLSSLAAQIPLADLVGLYPFSNNANDVINNNNGTVSNATLTTDRFGNANNAYYFNGTDASISLGTNPAINSILGDFSISYWVLPDSIGGCVFASYSPQGGSQWRIISRVLTNSGAVETDFMVGSTWQTSFSPNGTIPYLQWSNIVYTRSGTTTKIYCNGNLIYTGTVSGSNIANPTSPNATTVLGYNFPSNNNFYKGKLDDLAIYSRAITQQEVTSIYSANSFYYDTVQLTITDTTHVTVYDTNYVTIPVYDTTHVTINDTVTHLISVTDTLFIDVSLTGLPPTNENTLLVYPNPAKSHLYVNTGNYSLMNDYTLSIVNTLGQSVFIAAINQQFIEIDLNAWNGNGTYTLRISNAQSQTVATKTIILH